jgi:hypothetical protein
MFMCFTDHPTYTIYDVEVSCSNEEPAGMHATTNIFMAPSIIPHGHQVRHALVIGLHKNLNWFLTGKNISIFSSHLFCFFAVS